jgi:hypothetical protein
MKAVSTVMANKGEVPKETFLKQIKVKNCLYEEHLLAIKCCDVRNVFLLSTVHDRMAEIQAFEENKPKAVTDYNKHKTGAGRSNQLPSKSMK